MQIKVEKFQLNFTAGILNSAVISVTTFRALGVFPKKIATPMIRTRVGVF